MSRRFIRFSVAASLAAAAAVAVLTLPRAASANFAIDWSTNAGLPVGSVLDFTPGQSLVLTGTTTGSQLLPYTATLNFISSTSTDRFRVARATQGGIANTLAIVMGNGAGTRSAGQRITLDISVTGAPSLIATNFLVADVDTGANGTLWRDQVEVFTPGATLTVQNPAVVNVSGQIATANESAVGNTFPDGNVGVFFAPGVSDFSLEYRNGPNSPLDGTTMNVAVSNVSFITVPEASTFALALPALGMVGAVVIKRRKIA